MLEGTRSRSSGSREGSAWHARSKGETRAGRLVASNERWVRTGKKVHMLTHGASIQVRSSSGMRLTRRQSLDWSLKASVTTVRRWLPPFLAGFSPRDRKRRRWRRAPGRASLSLSLFFSLVSLPRRICVRVCACTCTDPRRGFSTYGPVKTYTAAEFIFRIGDVTTADPHRRLFPFAWPWRTSAQRDDAKWRASWERLHEKWSLQWCLGSI